MKPKQEQAGNKWPRWLMAGDCAVILEFGNTVSPAVNAQVLARARAIARAIAPSVGGPFGGSVEGPLIPGISEVVPAFCSLSVYFDPLLTDHERVIAACNALSPDVHETAEPQNVWHIPVCYDREFAPDLDGTAETLGISTGAVIKKHSESLFRVYVLGFMPGFPFLGGLDADLNLPRRSSPRARVPKGSVAIATGLGGVYPFESPGGWHILGHTPTHMYDPDRDPAVFVSPGDGVRFVPVPKSVHDLLESKGGTTLMQLKGEVPFDRV